MKRVGLFLLAVVLAVGVAGCGGGGSSDPTIADVYLDPNCNGRFREAAVGRLYAIEFPWESGEVSIYPGQTIGLELPQGGLYRIFFETRRGYWDYTQHAEEGVVTQFRLACGP